VKRIVAVVLAWSAASAVVAADSTLIDAVKGKQHEAAVALIEKGADVRAREVDGTTALHYAAHYEDADLVKRLLKAGADVKAVNDYGATALSEAAVTGNPEIIKSLLAAGADAKATNKEGQTTLMVVARTGHVEAAKLLLKARVDVNATEQWGGQTALMWAAAQSQPQMVKLLIQHKADVNARAVVRDWQRRITAEGRPKDMNHGGLTPLLYAAREGCVECARELIKGGADIDLADPDGTTPLVLALTNMRFDLAAYLIKAGADINKWDFYGQTPLYVAVDLNTLPRGGRPDLPSTDNLSGYDVAAQLLAAGANPNPQLKLRPPYRNAVFDRGGDQVLSTGATRPPSRCC
jgi:ankyrin repeat protein